MGENSPHELDVVMIVVDVEFLCPFDDLFVVAGTGNLVSSDQIERFLEPNKHRP